MKKKRLLSLLLSTIMLIGSMPALVLAEGDEDYEDDPEMMDPGEEEDDVPYLGSISENSVFPVGQMEAQELLFFDFMPTTTGRYGFMCADGRDLSATFYDDKGEVAPMEQKKDFRYDIQYLNLEAGKYYQIEIEAGEYATLPDQDAYCYICPMSETLPFGESTLFVKSSDGSRKYTFIPQESGKYYFEAAPLVPKQNHNTSFSISSSYEEIKYTYSGKLLCADLKAGMPYDIKITYNRESAGNACCNLVKVNITRDVPALEMGENTVQLRAQKDMSSLVFVPENSGIYVFESKGEYDTEATLRNGGYDYGEGDNFRLGCFLDGGETYFLQAWQNSADLITVPVYVQRAEQIQSGQEVSFDAMYRDRYFFSMTPAESGWYHLDDGKTSHSISVYDRSNSTLNNCLDSWYLTAGETYMLEYQYYDYGNENGTVKFTFDRVPTELVSGASSTVTKYAASNSVFYTEFTPDESGVYEFTSEHKTSAMYIFDAKNKVLSEDTTDSKLNKSAHLYAGTKYLIAFSDWQEPDTPYVVSLKKSEETVQADVKYEVDFPSRNYRQYSFTPKTSGFYLLYTYGGFSSYNVYDGSTLLSGVLGTGEYGFKCRLVELEAGKNYRIEFKHSNSSLDGMYWCIHKVEALTMGTDIPFDAIGGYAFYTFTPSESGVYTFTSDMFLDASYAYIEVRQPTEKQNDYIGVATLSDSIMKNAISTVLKKGTTYVVYAQLKNKVSTSSTIDIVKEQALQLGDNTVPIKNRNTNYDFQRNAFCSFTPAEDGLYSIMSKGENGVDPRITIYDSQMKKVGDDDSSGEVNWNFKVELFLNGGETYYIDIDETEEFDLPVEIQKLEIMEAKLEGYTLSLDGSIAVNLYMTLNKSVAESDTAVLKFTRETASGNTVVSYGMDQAQKRVLDGKTYYVFHLPVAAKEMTSELKAQIVDPASAFEGKEYKFTVQEYAQYIINRAYSTASGSEENQEYMDALPLVYALLNYGTAAQNYFGFKVDKPANSINYTSSKYMGNVPTSSLPVYSEDSEVLPEGVTFEGSSVAIESETELTFCFKNSSGAKLTFTDGSGTRLSAGKSGGYITVKVKGIPAHKLGEYVTVRIKVEGDANDYKVSYNPMTYCYNVLTRPLTATRTSELKELMKAFYFYNQAAERYMAKKAGN